MATRYHNSAYIALTGFQAENVDGEGGDQGREIRETGDGREQAGAGEREGDDPPAGAGR